MSDFAFTFTPHQTIASAEDELRDHISVIEKHDIPDDHYDVNALVDVFYNDIGTAIYPYHRHLSESAFLRRALPHAWT